MSTLSEMPLATTTLPMEDPKLLLFNADSKHLLNSVKSLASKSSEKVTPSVILKTADNGSPLPFTEQTKKESPPLNPTTKSFIFKSSDLSNLNSLPLLNGDNGQYINNNNKMQIVSSSPLSPLTLTSTDLKQTVCRSLSNGGSVGELLSPVGEVDDESGDVIPPILDNSLVKVAESDRALHVLKRDCVLRLHDVLGGQVGVAARHSSLPTLHVQLGQLLMLVRDRLLLKDVKVRDIRLNGGAASYIIGMEAEETFSDIDILFGVDLSQGSSTIKTIQSVVIDCLATFLPEASVATFTSKSPRLTFEAAIREAYVHKMIWVNNSPADTWSLIALGHQSKGGRTVELKFVDKMRRQFEFTVDSFQIMVDSLLTFYEVSSLPITENFYPTILAEAVSGDFDEALYHLHNRLIATRNPEEIRGGGLLKYCKLLVEGYQPTDTIDIGITERYMCSRFFIDFPDLSSQRSKLEAYLQDHFFRQDDVKVAYLTTLYEVVRHSTVCLMNHERRQTLHLIDQLVEQVLADIEIKQSVVHLEEFSGQNWVLDQVFYGTAYFPPQATASPAYYTSCCYPNSMHAGMPPPGAIIATTNGGCFSVSGSGDILMNMGDNGYNNCQAGGSFMYNTGSVMDEASSSAGSSGLRSSST